MRAIVTGMIATYPVGGVVWDYAQYALGLERLGWEVCYLEDTGTESYDPRLGLYGEDPSYGVGFLEDALTGLSESLGRRWHFRAMDGTTYGLAADKFRRLLAGSHLFLNVSGSALLREAYLACPNKVLIDTDPGWNHFVNYPQWDKSPGWQGTAGYRAHDHFFTYAERLGSADCPLPDMGLRWLATRPPVVLDCWDPAPPAEKWTTVMTWNNFRRPIPYQDKVYGTKEMEFPKVEILPARLPNVRFELATGGQGAPVERWLAAGWGVVDSHVVSATPDAYRNYVQTSRGEFSVAKNVYAATRCGWFSCRSVCYLAAGRPVVVQDTGFSEYLPHDQGLLTFTVLDEAVEAIRCVEADYDSHARAARRVASGIFDSRVVLSDLLRRIDMGS